MAFKMKGFPQHKGIKATPVKKLDDPSVGDQYYANEAEVAKTIEKEETKETEEEKKARLKKQRKATKKANRTDWRKRTGKRIKEEAISIGSGALKNALSDALTPRDKQIINPTTGFNVQFGNK